MTYTHQDLIKIGHQLNQGHFQIVGTEITFENGFIPTNKQLEETLLSSKKSEAVALIDQEFEAKRQTYLTAGPTQAMVYVAKYNEAKAYLDNPTGSYPMLQASIDAGEVNNLADAADLILGKAAQLAVIAAQFEVERLSRKKQIREAITIQEIE